MWDVDGWWICIEFNTHRDTQPGQKRKRKNWDIQDERVGETCITKGQH